jgi:serine/threonine-protein kinase
LRLRVRLGTLRWPSSRRQALIGLLWLVTAAIVVGGVFGLSFYWSVQSASRSTEVTVPDLRGLDLEASAEKVRPLELRLEVVDQRHDPAVSSGRVLEQMPRSGYSVRRGRKIRLVLSLGGEVLAVPDTIGEASRAVEIELRQEGFAIGEEARVRAPRTRAGDVIGQVPPPATPAVPGTRVHRLVSDGAPVLAWVMPDMIGLRRADAEGWISRHGFRRGAVRQVKMVGWPPGTVVGQLPLPGYPVRERDVVELTVAR